MKKMIGVLMLVCAACGESSKSDDPLVINNSTNNSVNNVNNDTQPARCPQACASKAAQCQAPAEQREGLCAMFCASGDDRALTSCLERESCQALAEAFERGPETVCQTTQPPQDMGQEPLPDMSSDECAQAGRRECLGDFEALRCERSSTGGVVRVTEACAMPIPNVSPGTVCEDGWCVDARLPGVGSSCTDKYDCRRPNDCQGGFCCQVEDERCTESEDCCGGRSCMDTSFGYKVCK